MRLLACQAIPSENELIGKQLCVKGEWEGTPGVTPAKDRHLRLLSPSSVNESLMKSTPLTSGSKKPQCKVSMVVNPCKSKPHSTVCLLWLYDLKHEREKKSEHRQYYCLFVIWGRRQKPSVVLMQSFYSFQLCPPTVLCRLLLHTASLEKGQATRVTLKGMCRFTQGIQTPAPICTHTEAPT